MIVAIMQPYFFPYIGYFQLMRAVDLFVFHDDAQYIKGGWINRNRILVGGHVDWLTMPVKSGSNYLPINRRNFANGPDVIEKMERRLVAAYAKSPSFDEASSTIFDLLSFDGSNVADFNCNSLTLTAEKFGIKCRFAKSSELDIPVSMKGQDKVIELCRRFKADCYINPIGGLDLYDQLAFAEAGISLSFLRTAAPPTSTEIGPQHLSVVDGVMSRGFEGCGTQLPEYTILRKEDARAQA